MENLDPHCGHRVGPRPANGTAMVGFGFSILGLLTCGLLSPLGLLVSLVALLKSPRGFATAGTIIGLVGTAWLSTVGYGILFVKSTVESRYGAYNTAASFQWGRDVVESYRQEHGRLPDPVKGNELVMAINDGWQQSILYAIEEDGSYLLRSAGPDGEFHTDDDLTSDMNLGETAWNPGVPGNIGQGLDDIGIDMDDLLIDGASLRVEEGDRILELEPGQIRRDPNSDETELNGASLRVQEGDRKVEIVPGHIRRSGENGSVEVGGASLNVQDGDRSLQIELPRLRLKDQPPAAD